MNVSDVMSKAVITAIPKTKFRDLWKSIFTHKVHALPVLDVKHKVIGIVAREDLLEKLYPNYEDLFGSEEMPDFVEMEDKISELSALTASDVMRRRVIFTREDTPIMRALSRMIVHHLNQLPVLTDAEELVGMISKGDIFTSVFKKQMKNRPKQGKKRISHKTAA